MDNGVAMGLTVSVMAVAVLAILDSWVYVDARSRSGKDRPVSAHLWDLTVDQPRVWLALCAVFFVFFFPLYLVVRQT